LARRLRDIMRLKTINRIPPSRNRKYERTPIKGLLTNVLYPKDAKIANRIKKDSRRTSLLVFHFDISNSLKHIDGKLRSAPSPPHLAPA
jgi:hypothetical protein